MGWQLRGGGHKNPPYGGWDHVYMCMCVFLHVSMLVCMLVHMSVCACVYIAGVHVRMYMCVHMHACTVGNTCSDTCIGKSVGVSMGLCLDGLDHVCFSEPQLRDSQNEAKFTPF